MQKVQNMLEFEIDTPSDMELAKQFAARQKNQAELLGACGHVAVVLKPSSTSRNAKKRQRKNAKKRAHQHV